MNGIVINIDPVLVHLGGFEVRWYSLAIMLAIVSAVFVASRLASKKGIAVDEIYTLAIWTVIGGIIGARLFHVFDQWGYYSAHPEQILQFQRGGLAIWGALAGGAVALLVVGKLRRLPLLRLLDVMAPALLTAQMVGRLGCIINGDAYGGLTSLPWGFIYTHPGAMIPVELFGRPTHPYPVYEIIWNALTLAVVLWLGSRVGKEGAMFFTYLSFYSVGRFLLTFVRQENIIVAGLQQAQIIALAILAGAMVTFFYLLRRRPGAAGEVEAA
ncbi:MAG: prolipoprotein diacylglyceryl transferase [Chloroflexi bacterium]|nr:prolipoprotein diacylglyceryl transferase [Chloroflexota bacterium]